MTWESLKRWRSANSGEQASCLAPEALGNWLLITSKVLGGAQDDFRFYAFKYPGKFPRLTSRQRGEAWAKRKVAKSR